MNYVVLDLEWNQGGNGEEPKKELTFEIIEIGAVKLSEDGIMVGEFSRLIKPQVYQKMHHITGKLLHMQMQEFEQGSIFPEVAADFLRWCGEDCFFCTWGPLDLTELQNNMRYYNMPPLSAKPLRFLDIQKLFSIAFEDGKSRKALEYAVDFLQIEKDIPFHRAFSDAYYAGKVLARIPKAVYANHSFDLFHPPLCRKDEVHAVFDGYAKYISRVFPDRKTAFADKEVISSKCYICHKNLRKRLRWFTPNGGKHYYCAAYCDVHGILKGKIRIRRTQDDAVYVVKTTKWISPEELEELKERMQNSRKHIQEQRRKKYHNKRKKKVSSQNPGNDLGA